MTVLTGPEVSEKLGNLPDWCLEGESIARRFAFADFLAAMVFVNRVAEQAEKAGHHPDIDIRWNKVRLALSSHDAGGLTVKDFTVAAAIDALV